MHKTDVTLVIENGSRSTAGSLCGEPLLWRCPAGLLPGHRVLTGVPGSAGEGQCHGEGALRMEKLRPGEG